MEEKFKSRKFILTWTTILIIIILQIIASFTKTDCSTAIITIAGLTGTYNVSNAIQKKVTAEK